MQSLSSKACLLPLKTVNRQMNVRVLPDDVGKDPQLDQTAHNSHPPVPHQHLARGLVLKEEVGDGVGDMALHLLSLADPQRGGSLSSHLTGIETVGLHFSSWFPLPRS